MEFSIKLAGWVLDAPVFHLKKTYMALKLFILPVEHFKANMSKRDDVGLIKVKKQVDFKIHSR